MNQNDDAQYLKQGAVPLTTDSSILISSSKYLNSAAMRNVVSQEMLRKYGNDLPPAYFIPEMQAAFDEVTDYQEVLQLIERERSLKPEFAEWLDARFISDMKQKSLEGCKPGTLGAMVYAFVTESGFDIDFMFKGAPEDDYQYWLKRFVQSHDIQHMVTGFDLSPIGEYALIMLNTNQYFEYFSPELAAQFSQQTTLQVCCGLMRANLHYPKTMPLLLEALSLSREMSLSLNQPLFYVKWEDYWDCSIEEIRQDLNIVGAPGKDAWAWAYDEMKNASPIPKNY